MIAESIDPSGWSPLSFGLAATKVGVLVWALYLAGGWLSAISGRRARFAWNRTWVMVILTAAVITIKLGTGVMTNESAPLDHAVLGWLHQQSSSGLVTTANMVSLMGSWRALLPVSLLSLCGLLAMRRSKEAVYVAACTLAGIILTVTLKMVIGRERPALWDHEDYWGSSFPSGHTLNTTCVAIALAVCAGRIWPRAAPLAVVAAVAYILSVGLSRMVLGVHWPTDVAAAASIGLTTASVIHLYIFPATGPSGPPERGRAG